MNKAIFAAGLLALLICQLVMETMATDDEDEQNPLHALNKRSGEYAQLLGVSLPFVLFSFRHEPKMTTILKPILESSISKVV